MGGPSFKRFSAMANHSSVANKTLAPSFKDKRLDNSVFSKKGEYWFGVVLDAGVVFISVYSKYSISIKRKIPFDVESNIASTLQ